MNLHYWIGSEKSIQANIVFRFLLLSFKSLLFLRKIGIKIIRSSLKLMKLKTVSLNWHQPKYSKTRANGNLSHHPRGPK